MLLGQRISLNRADSRQASCWLAPLGLRLKNDELEDIAAEQKEPKRPMLPLVTTQLAHCCYEWPYNLRPKISEPQKWYDHVIVPLPVQSL